MIKHIGFIMDGNRRYGKKQNLQLKEAYLKGLEKFLEMVSLQVKYDIKETSFFALSTDNFSKRKITELIPLLDLIENLFENKEIEEFFIKYSIKLNVKGDIEKLNKDSNKKFPNKKNLFSKIQKKADKWNSEISKHKYIVNLAINYDGQKEILHSFKQILKKVQDGEIKEKSITEKTIKKHLWFNENEPPEVIVRPGDAPRLSGFMLFDSEYSEIYLTHKLWPELSEIDLVKIIEWYKNQNRNFGK